MHILITISIIVFLLGFFVSLHYLVANNNYESLHSTDILISIITGVFWIFLIPSAIGGWLVECIETLEISGQLPNFKIPLKRLKKQGE